MSKMTKSRYTVIKNAIVFANQLEYEVTKMHLVDASLSSRSSRTQQAM